MRNYLTKIDRYAPDPRGKLRDVEDNWRFGELNNIVTSAGITLDNYNATVDSDLFMLAQAFSRYTSGGVFCIDTGNANVYLLKLSSTFKPPKALFTGMMVAFYPAHSSTDASVINAFDLGSKRLLRADGGSIAANDITANRLTAAVYDESLDNGLGAWRMTPWAIPYSLVTPSALPTDGEGVNVDDVYACNLAYATLSAATPADADPWPFYSQTAHAHRKVTTAQLIALIRAGLSLGSGPISYTKIAPTLRIEERRANLTSGPGCVDSVWTRRPLSAVVRNDMAAQGAGLNGQQIVLPAGSYRAEFVGIAANAKSLRNRLYNVTANAQLGVSVSIASYSGVYEVPGANSVSVPSRGLAWFSLAVTSVIEFQYFVVLGDHGAVLGDPEPQNIGSGNYFVDGWVSITKEG